MTDTKLDALAREYRYGMRPAKFGIEDAFKAGYAAAESAGIKIGKYHIVKHLHEGYWIEHESGEGMQTTEALEKCIDEFYKREF